MKLKKYISKETNLIFDIFYKQKNRIVKIVILLLMISGCNAIMPMLSATIIDNGMITKDLSTLFNYSTVLLFLNMVVAIFYICVEYIRLKGFNEIQTELKKITLNKLMSVNVSFYNKRPATSVYQQVDEDINAIAGCFGSDILMSIMQVFISVVMFPILFQISWKLSLIVIIAVPVNFIKSLVFAKLGYDISKKRIGVFNEYSGLISNLVSGTLLIRYFNLGFYFHNVFTILQNKVSEANLQQGMFSEVIVRIEALLINFITYALYIFGGYLIVKDELTIGNFIAFQTYSLSILYIIERFIDILCGFATIKPSAERFFEFLKEENEESGELDITGSEVNISIKDVCFSYKIDEPILCNINMDIPYGSHIGIIGRNGSGKTTFINLLLKIIKPQSGEIAINGTSIEKFKISSYRNLFAVASQNPYFFCDTIKNNICLYRDIPLENLDKVIETVGLSNFVDDNTLEYCVGEDGCELSGGQRQRLSIARVLVGIAPIIIFDEPETYLDADLKKRFEQIIREDCINKTVIVITHSNEILGYMDKIYDLEKNSLKFL